MCPEMSKSHVAVLKCNFTGRPRVNITWKYPGKIKGIETSMHQGSNGLISSVSFFNVTSVPYANDNYKITCNGENLYGKAEQVTVLSIRCKYKLRVIYLIS